jgi:hypothetical protein
MSNREYWIFQPPSRGLLEPTRAAGGESVTRLSSNFSPPDKPAGRPGYFKNLSGYVVIYCSYYLQDSGINPSVAKA